MSRYKAEIVEKHNKLLVRIDLGTGRLIYADRDPHGRIKYTEPEHVPRVLKHTIVPKLFKEIDNRIFGMQRV